MRAVEKFSKERKRTKKKETEGRGRLMETAAAEEIDQGGLRQYFSW